MNESTAAVCKEIITIRGGSIMNCDLNDTSLLTNLDENIKMLWLRRLGYEAAIVAHGPLKCGALTWLAISITLFRVPRDFFSLLHNLENLTISYTSFENDAAPELPPSLINLKIIEYLGNPLDLSKLYRLQELTYSSSMLIEFPSIPNSAPIRFLDFYDNNLTNLRLPDISQYCLLKRIDLGKTNIYEGSKKTYCEFKAWLASHKIEYELSSPSHDFKITDQYCEEIMLRIKDATSESEIKYNQCLHKLGEFPLLFLIAVVSVSLVIIGMLYLRVVGLICKYHTDVPQFVQTASDFYRKIL